jgi:ubiquinone/menaquinone biosynthesis C-methylase UbiE
VAVVLTLVTACALRAEAPPSDDATSRHDFADVAHWSSVFDDPARDAWQKPAELVAALGLARGSVVADLGAGTGYLSSRLAAAVGPEGTVLAVETEPNLVVHLRARAEREKTPNVVPVLASPAEARLPVGLVDLILVVDTYHHFDDRRTYLRALRRFLRPSGRVAIVDWQKRELPVGPAMDHKLPREQVLEEMRASGYRLAAEHTMLPYQYFLVFAQAEPGADSPGTPTR